MNAGGETADQAVRMTLQGIEMAANVALKAGGIQTLRIPKSAKCCASSARRDQWFPSAGKYHSKYCIKV